MSAPTRQFCKLSIASSMSRPRSQNQRARPTEDDNNDDSENFGSDSEESEMEAGDSGESLTAQGKSGITYDLARLNSALEARALVGFSSQFEVITCCSMQTGYDFQLAEKARVHLGSDTYTCTCSAFSSQSNVACQHIFWLLDQLYACLLPQIVSSVVPLASDGRLPNFSRAEQLLDGKLEAVADQLGWQYVRSEAAGGMSRSQKARDLLSAFSMGGLPEDFRLDLVDDTGLSRTPEQCVVQGDFEATLFRLTVHDDAVYSSLCKAMPPGACAAIYFDKIQGRSRKLLTDFDLFCQTGKKPESGADVDVANVIRELQYNVDRIQWNITARAPHGMEGAVKALVTLLEDICNRNKDALDGNRWGRTSFHGEDEDERNVYHQLIGTTDETGRCFILDTLELLQGSDLHQFGAKLHAILHKNEVNRAPRAFLLKLSSLVRRAESASTASGQKRPATGVSGGNSKRTR
ncbi:hypothetical protein N8T08_006261 [Aspergillus melleus]|uniref:Uncharacterized protein n=1 Tax=Aspergillus melleus TaxID=138277 RepID=A0ACC3B0C4_9EURO|nr:hypothetical protein N8T08_006261 [Aspergillus melleus]